MRRYFFDTYDDEAVILDDEGHELATFEKVRIYAASSLAELAREVLPESTRRHLAVKVRDEKGRSILVTELTYEARAHIQPVD